MLLDPHPTTIAIIQARMGSSRLPGKVLLDIGGAPMLSRVVERTQRAKTVHQVVVATTTEVDDDPVTNLCIQRGYACYRGSLHDVLDRYYQAALLYKAKVIVRITADCPLIDPDLIDSTIQAFLGAPSEALDVISSELSDTISNSKSSNPNPQFPYDFAANRLPPPWGRTYPIGLDTEVTSFHALQLAWQKAGQKHQREHVMPYLYENKDKFRVLLVNHKVDYGSLRWTVDTPDDLVLLRKIFAHFDNQDDFSWLDVIELFKQQPHLAEINAQVRHKIYNEVDPRGQ